MARFTNEKAAFMAGFEAGRKSYGGIELEPHFRGDEGEPVEWTWFSAGSFSADGFQLTIDDCREDGIGFWYELCYRRGWEYEDIAEKDGFSSLEDAKADAEKELALAQQSMTASSRRA